jgi:S-adenosylmethionine synthetase
MIHLPKIYTVESVTSGHPDKICDQISDAILDECLKQDPKSRVAMETFGAHGLLVIGGELTTKAKVDFAKVAERVDKDIGHTEKLKIITNVVQQSPDIAMGVDTGGAGDQGIMYGYATDETPEFMPKAVVLAHKLTKGLEKLRKSGKVKWLKPDGKSQVTMSNGRIETVLIGCQHDEKVSQEEIKTTLAKFLVNPLLKKAGEDPLKVQFFVNLGGRFVLGGFAADTGLTGRKIMVDTYGGLIPHGGGCFSGKDPTKVDRSGAYAARWVAVNLVAAGLAKKAEVQVAYAIGVARPLAVNVNTYGTGKIPDRQLGELVQKVFDLRPGMIIKALDLRRPLYRQVAVYGHFGRPELNLPWEKRDKVAKLKKMV